MSARTGIAVTFLTVLVIIAVSVSLVLLGGDRAGADDCHKRGGVPVQGDSIRGHGVVCLSPESVLP